MSPNCPMERMQRALLGLWREVWPGPFGPLRRELTGRIGLEVGGPSGVFRRGRLWSLYPVLGALDLVNFADATIWTGDARIIVRSMRPGLVRRLFTAEATRLAELPDGAYDFLLASHVIEHVANPLAALREWIRVVRPGGIVFVIVPHRDGTFDHRRPATTLAHLVADYRAGTGEDDTTHMPEVLALHDLTRDPGAGDAAAFAARIRRNGELRSMHHHVFDTVAALRLLDAAGLQLEYVDVAAPHHIAVAGRAVAGRAAAFPEPGAGAPAPLPHNLRWLGPDASWRADSPFPSDRTG